MIYAATIRSSSVWELGDCALRWQKKYLDGVWKPATAPAGIGTAVHASTAVYDRGRMPGGDAVSISDAAGAAVDVIRHPEEEIDWGDVSPREREQVALRVHTAYCTEVSPSREYTAVEHTLKPMTIDVDSVEITLTGTLDRIRSVDGRHGVCDVKSGARAVSKEGRAVTSKHGAQLATYETLADHDPDLPFDITLAPEIIGLNTGKTPRVGTGEIPDARRALIGDDDNPGFLEYIAQYFRSGLFPPNPSSILCSQRYCPWWDRCLYKA